MGAETEELPESVAGQIRPSVAGQSAIRENGTDPPFRSIAGQSTGFHPALVLTTDPLPLSVPIAAHEPHNPPPIRGMDTRAEDQRLTQTEFTIPHEYYNCLCQSSWEIIHP